MRRFNKRVLLWLGIPTLLLIALLVPVCVLLGTSGGRVWLVEQLLDRVNQTAVQVELNGLQTSSLGHWQWASMSISRNQEPLLYIADLNLRFSPMALLSRQVKVDSLTAAKVQWYRLPNPPPPVEPEPKEPFTLTLPDSPLRLTVEHLRADFIELPAGLFGDLDLPEQWELEGNADLFAKNAAPSVNLQLSALDGTPTDFTINSQLLEDGSMRISGTFAEHPGGALGLLIKQPSGLEAQFALSIDTEDGEVIVGIEQLQTHMADHPITLRGTLRLVIDGNALQIPELIMATGDNQHKFQGAYTPDDAWLDARLRTFPLELLTPWVPELTAGQVSGDLNLSWRHSESDSWPSGTAQIQSQATYQQLQFSADIDGQLKDKVLHLNPSKLSLDAMQLQMQGRMEWEGDNSQLEAQLTNASTDVIDKLQLDVPPEVAALKVSIPKADLKLSGHWRDPYLFINTQAEGSYQEQPFALQLDAKGNRRRASLNALVLETGGGRLNAVGTLDWTDSQTALKLQLDNLNDALLQLAPPQYVTSLQDLSFAINGEAQISGPLTRPEVQSDLTVDGQYSGRGEPLPYSLVSKGTIRVGNPSELRIRLEAFRLSLFDNPVVSAQGNYQRETLDLTLDVTRLPTQTLSLFGLHNVTGEAQAHIQLSGNFDNPVINGQATYSDDIVIHEKTARRVPAQLTFDLQTTDGILQLQSLFKMDDEQVGNMSIELPLKPYLEPAEDELPLDIKVRGQMDLAVSRWFLDPSLHDLRGNLQADLRVAGTTTLPTLDGEMTLDDGYYEHMVSRTQWESLTARIRAQDTTLQIQEMSARSGSSGSVTISGAIDWGESRRQDNDAIDLAMQAKDAIVMRQRNLYAEIDGELSVEGSFAEIWVRGKASVSPLDASIDAAIQSTIPSITVTEVTQDTTEDKPSLMPTTHLDLTLYTEQQAFIRGRGLEAELEGSFQIRGTAKDPSYTGQLGTKQGKMDIFGKRFILQGGQIRLSNDVVSLRIPATYSSDDLEVTAEIYGTSDEPKLRLSSVPSLPEDEILSRLIFGKSVEQVTPFQAVRLASAVNGLRSGGGFDPVDSARQFLGVDTLNIENESTENGSGVSVGVGKYINERVYLQLEKSPNPAQPWQGKVQIELTPKLRLESGTSENGGAGAELLWKKDY